MSIGVGIIGAGAVTQSIHLPTLARLRDLFRVRHVMDVDPGTARAVAARAGSRWSTEVDELLEDGQVDVVVVCSPPQLHAQHVVDSARSGKSVVLCEKPLATTVEDAATMIRVAKETGTTLLVGTMHLYDPGWVAAEGMARELAATTSVVRSSIVLPFNDRFERWGTEFVVAPARVPPALDTVEDRARVLTQRVLGVAIHDLPLIRSLLPAWREARVSRAALLNPTSYAVSIDAGDRVVQLTGSMRGYWRPEWQLELLADRGRLNIDFSPSFVHAGSAVASATVGKEHRAWGPYSTNGYEEEWRLAAQAFSDPNVVRQDPKELLNDLEFALAISDAAGAAMRMEAKA